MTARGGIRIGTASWTDPEFITAGWYPDDVKNDAEGRLRYYADHFSLVEVNATFYALPRRSTVDAWAERTPDDFRLHMKAHQVISGHASEPGRLPAPLRELPYEADHRGRIRTPSRELRDAVIDAFVEVIAPLRHKMGAVLLQLPPHVASGPASRAEIGRIVERLAHLTPARPATRRIRAGGPSAPVRRCGRLPALWAGPLRTRWRWGRWVGGPAIMHQEERQNDGEGHSSSRGSWCGTDINAYRSVRDCHDYVPPLLRPRPVGRWPVTLGGDRVEKLPPPRIPHGGSVAGRWG